MSPNMQLVPKPKFLEQLETFLQNELRCLRATTVEPSELRLQVYREVFQYLIEDFKTYKPLLASIKNEYEMVLTYQREQIEQLLPLQEMLVTVAEQCEQKIMGIREQEKQEIKDLKSENRRLYEKIDSLHNEHVSLREQVSKLEEELASQYLRYRDEHDARKLLIADINDLRYQQEEMMSSKANIEAQDAEKEDPVMLRIALQKAREDEMEASRRLNEMVANYGDVIPRRDYQQLQKHYEDLEDKLEMLKSDFNKLKTEHDTLLEVHKQVLQQRDDYYIDSETLRRTATPRPNWNHCGDFVAGGPDHWHQLIEGKTSEQIVDILITELQEAASNTNLGKVDAFDGLGTGEDVPLYLRFEGTVHNRHPSKRDCALLIRDIWRQKGRHDAQQRVSGQREKLSDYMYTYLRHTFGLEQIAIEWGYSLRDAVQKYSVEPRIGLFYKILIDEADEELHFDYLQLLMQLAAALKLADEQHGGYTGALSREDFTLVLTNFFRAKDGESILSLVKAAEIDLGSKVDEPLQYENLFVEDHEGQTGPFLEELRRQTDEERLQYAHDIMDALDGKTPVSADDVKRAIITTDPQVDPDSIDRPIQWLFMDPAKPGEILLSRDADDCLLTRLQNCSLRRAGPKP
jgi:hypothetical protein